MVKREEHQIKNKAAPIIKEKTPEPEAYKVPDWLEWQDDTGTPVSMTPEDDDGTSVQVILEKTNIDTNLVILLYLKVMLNLENDMKLLNLTLKK